LNSKKIVITGGPGTGKTSIINELKNQNHYCFDEFIRELTLKAKEEVDTDLQISNPIAFVNNPLEFNTQLLKGRLEQFKQATALNKELVFFDRGIPDVLAYMNFFNQEYNDEFLKICHNNKYSHVFLLPPWKAIYKSDSGRFETFEEAIKIYKSLKQAYKNLGYSITEVPFGTIDKRIDFIINNL